MDDSLLSSMRLIIFLCSGAIVLAAFGGALAGVFFGMQYRKATDNSDKPLPVIQRTSFTVPLAADQAFQKALGSLDTIKARPTSIEQESGTIYARTGMTFRSWGETLTITVRGVVERRSEITILSKPLMPTILVDWGKSRENVALLTRYLTSEAPPPQ